MGPDLRIALSMGPPVLATGAPVVNPNMPNMGPNIPMPTPGQTAAANLRGYALGAANKPCKHCGPNGPTLADVAPPSWISKMPRWAFWLGGIVGLGGTAALIIWLARR